MKKIVKLKCPDCGKYFIREYSRQKYCNRKCAIHWHNNHKMRDVKALGKRDVVCHCIYCDQDYIRTDLDWTGRGKPRKYCSSCRKIIKTIEVL